MTEFQPQTKIEFIQASDYLLPGVEVIALGSDDKQSYLLRDLKKRRHHDCEDWQWAALEALPSCDSFSKLSEFVTVRTQRTVTRKQVEEYFSFLVDEELVSTKVEKHPLFAHCFQNKPSPVRDFERKAHFFPPRLARAAAGSSAGAISAPMQEMPAAVKDYFTHDPKILVANSYRFFDPRPALRHILPFVQPLFVGVYFLPLLMLAAGMTIYHDSAEFVGDMRFLYNTVTLIVHMTFSLITIDIFSQTITACVGQYFGATVNEVSIAIYFGFLPRLVTRVSYVEKLPRPAQLWIHSSSILARFFLQSIGVLIWHHTKSYSMAAANLGLGLFMMASIDLIFASGNPFTKGVGYRFLSAYLDSPNLRGEAFDALRSLITGRVSAGANVKHRKALAIYGFILIGYMFILGYYVVNMVSDGLFRMQIGNSAYVLVGALTLYLVVGQFVRLYNMSRALFRYEQYGDWERRIKLALESESPVIKPADQVSPSRYAFYALVPTALIVLMLPYPYDPGGNLMIYPKRRVEVTTDVAGIVSQVYFDGGESVKKGTPIARLKDDDDEAKLETSEAEVRAQQHVVDNLKTLPKPEEIKVAEAELATAQTHAAYSAERVPRFRKLYKKGAMSFNEFEAAVQLNQVNVDQVAQKRATLALVKAGPTVDEVAAAEYKLEGLKQLRDEYQDRVNRSVLYMPFDGRIATLHLAQKAGTYLEKGKLFAMVEDNSEMTVEVDVPEWEIGPIAEGKLIRAHPDAFSDQEFQGKVVMTTSDVIRRQEGNVVKVMGSIQNEGGKLLPGMSGYAKIDTPSVPVWKAFGNPELRYFCINVWSWIP
jgi:putative peptide zinc metalloprotease protein